MWPGAHVERDDPPDGPRVGRLKLRHMGRLFLKNFEITVSWMFSFRRFFLILLKDTATDQGFARVKC